MTDTSLAPVGPPQLSAAPREPGAIMDIMASLKDRPDAVALIDKLATLYQEAEARQAERAFNRAMAGFQELCPPVHKRRKVDSVSHNSGVRTKYNFASKSDVLTEIGPYLVARGLSVTFSTEKPEQAGFYRALCIVRHADGHSTTTPFEGPIDSGKMSDIQKRGSTQSYYERYAMCAALGIVVSDIEDDDGRSGPGREVETITTRQAGEISALLKEWGAPGTDVDRFFSWAGCLDIPYIPAHKFDEAKKLLLQKVANAVAARKSAEPSNQDKAAGDADREGAPE